MNEPTLKQKEYAKAISEWYNVKLPTENTKDAYSVWLNSYAPRYKKEMFELKLEHEVDMEMIDARRDW